jgi:hypothetical protein
MARLITAQPKFKLLVANIENAGDPSRGYNPVKVRTGFEKQLLPEVPRVGARTRSPDHSTPGVHTYQGLLDYTVPLTPVTCTGTVEVVDNDFSAAATLYLGPYILVSNEDFTPASGAIQATGTLTVNVTPSTSTITIGGQALTPAAGARTPGANDYDATLGTAALIATEIAAAINDALNGFVAIVTATNLVPGQVELTAVPVGALGNAVTLTSSTGDVTVSGATLTGGVDADAGTATALAAVIDALPEFTASAVGAVITITGPFGPNGNELLFEAIYAGVVANYTLTPTEGFLTAGEPFIGPPTILP